MIDIKNEIKNVEDTEHSECDVDQVDQQEIGIYFMPTDTDEETLVQQSAREGGI